MSDAGLSAHEHRASCDATFRTWREAVGVAVRVELVHVWTAPWVQGVCCMI